MTGLPAGWSSKRKQREIHGVVQELFHTLCPQGPLFLLSLSTERVSSLGVSGACLAAVAAAATQLPDGGLPWFGAGRGDHENETKTAFVPVSLPQKGPLPWPHIKNRVSFGTFSIYSSHVAVGFGLPEPRVGNT